MTAELELEATISGSRDLLKIDKSQELFTTGIPDAGIAVKGIFKLGATLSYSVGVSSEFKGQGVVDLGLKASLPNSAKVTADFKNKDGNNAVGFDGASFEPIFDVKSLSASVEVIAYSKAKISFGIEVTKIEKLDVAVTLQVPKVTTTLTAAFGEPLEASVERSSLTRNPSDEQGACSTGLGSSKTGVKLDSQVALEVDLDLDADLGSATTPAKTFPLFVCPLCPFASFSENFVANTWQIDSQPPAIRKMLPYQHSRLEPRITDNSFSPFFSDDDPSTDFDPHTFTFRAHKPHCHHQQSPVGNRIRSSALRSACTFGTAASRQLEGTVLSHRKMRVNEPKEKQWNEDGGYGSEQ